jgi:hypothetical protein
VLLIRLIHQISPNVAANGGIKDFFLEDRVNLERSYRLNRPLTVSWSFLRIAIACFSGNIQSNILRILLHAKLCTAEKRKGVRRCIDHAFCQRFGLQFGFQRQQVGGA